MKALRSEENKDSYLRVTISIKDVGCCWITELIYEGIRLKSIQQFHLNFNFVVILTCWKAVSISRTLSFNGEENDCIMWCHTQFTLSLSSRFVWEWLWEGRGLGSNGSGGLGTGGHGAKFKWLIRVENYSIQVLSPHNMVIQVSRTCHFFIFRIFSSIF